MQRSDLPKKSHERLPYLEQRLLAHPQEDRDRVDLLLFLSLDIGYTDAPRALKLAEQAYELADRIDYHRGRLIARRNMLLGGIYGEAPLEQMLRELHELLHWSEEHEEDPVELGWNYISLASVYWSLGHRQRGYEYAYRVLGMIEAQDEEIGDEAGWVHVTLANFHYDSGEYNKARERFSEARELFVRFENDHGLARAKAGLGNVLRQDGRLEHARDTLLESLLTARKSGHEITISRVLNDLGVVEREQQEYQIALSYFEEALALREKLGYRFGSSTTLLDMGELYLATGEHAKAEQAFRQAFEAADSMQAKPKMSRALRGLALCCENSGDLAGALKNLRHYHAIEESFREEEAERVRSNLQAVYEAEQAQRESSLLREKNEQLARTLERLSAAQAQLMQEGKAAALGRLAAGVAHEAGSPAGAIHSNMDVWQRAIARAREQLQDDPLDREELQRLLGVIEQASGATRQATDRILELVTNLRRFSQLDEAPRQTVDVHEGLEATIALMGPMLDNGRIDLVREFDRELPPLACYPGELNRAFMNLLSNGVAAIGSGRGSITVRTWGDEKQLSIEVTDNGRGIEPERMQSIFEPEFTEREGRVRMRTGLFSTYTVVQQHGGDLDVRSDPGSGSSFTMRLPLVIESS